VYGGGVGAYAEAGGRLYIGGVHGGEVDIFEGFVEVALDGCGGFVALEGAGYFDWVVIIPSCLRLGVGEGGLSCVPGSVNGVRGG
jgi:hypothetical protein